MAKSNSIDNLTEELNITSKLVELSKKLGENDAKRLGVTKAINSIEKKIIEKSGEYVKEKLKIRNIQKEISKLAIEFEEKMLDVAVNGTRLKEIISEITKKRKQELKLTEDISNQEKIRSSKMDLFNTLGIGKTLELYRKLKEESNLTVKLLTLSNKVLIDFLNLFREVDGAAADFRKNMGFVRSDTQILEKNVRASYFSLAHTGVVAKDLYDSLQAISQVIGTSQASTQGMREDMALMSVSLGVAQATSAEFSRTMGMMAKNTMDSQKDISLFLSKLSAAAGTNLNEVMADVASAAKSSYQFMIRNPAALAKAAVEAKKMGTSISEAASAANTLIRFTENVKAEMEASVLLGESINLQRARELAYRKDTAGLNKEILEIAKKIRFETLDPFQQEAIAKAFGKDAEYLGRMLQADREMARIRADGSLAKQVAEYDKLKNANDDLVKSTAESAREQLKLKSNMEATKSIAIAAKSIYQSMLSPFIDFGTFILPKIAAGLSWLNQGLQELGTGGKIIMGLVSAVLMLVGVRGLGKIVSWATGGIGKAVGNMLGGISGGVRTFGGMDVIRGAAGMFLVAMSLVPLAYALKLMEGLKWETLAMAGSALLGLLGAFWAISAIGASMTVAWEFLLAGAAALVLIGAALIPAAYAFKLFGQSLGIIKDINLLSIAGGLMAMIGPLTILASLSAMFPLMAGGMGLLGLALRSMIGPIEKMGIASMQLGTGLEKAVSALSKLAELKIGETLDQFKNLSTEISNISKTLNEIPDIKIEKLRDIIIKTGEIGATKSQESNTEIIKALIDIKIAIETMRSSLEKGGIKAIAHIGAPRFNLDAARVLGFEGEL